MDLEKYLEQYNAIVDEQIERHEREYEEIDESYVKAKYKTPEEYRLLKEKDKLNERYNRELEREKVDADVANGNSREVWAEYLEHAQEIDEKLTKAYERFTAAIDYAVKEYTGDHEKFE